MVGGQLKNRNAGHPQIVGDLFFFAGKDVFWYTREKKDEDDVMGNELRAIKEREEELMAEVCAPFLEVTSNTMLLLLVEEVSWHMPVLSWAPLKCLLIYLLWTTVETHFGLLHRGSFGKFRTREVHQLNIQGVARRYVNKAWFV